MELSLLRATLASGCGKSHFSRQRFADKQFLKWDHASAARGNDRAATETCWG